VEGIVALMREALPLSTCLARLRHQYGAKGGQMGSVTSAMRRYTAVMSHTHTHYGTSHQYLCLAYLISYQLSKSHAFTRR
jgi:hypothetical protein